MTDLKLPGATVLLGDCIARMKDLPDRSVQMCVTSPPYFGLRDYGHDGQLGLEETPELYITAMVEVFREVRRVLADDGTLWVNIGDSYSANKGMGNTGRHESGEAWGGDGMDKRAACRAAGIKPKDLIGIPWLLAFALRADGWYLRQDIIWHKPNPMPESVTDRCTKAHEYVFLLSKSERYFYDHEAVKEPAAQPDRKRADRFGGNKHTGATTMHSDGSVFTGSETRNRRSVWSIATKPYKGAHFAVFPPALVEPCILAGSRPGDTVLDPFNGSGTTGEVSILNGRNYVGTELNPDYLGLTQQRLEAAIATRAEQQAEVAAAAAQQDLFAA